MGSVAMAKMSFSKAEVSSCLSKDGRARRLFSSYIPNISNMFQLQRGLPGLTNTATQLPEAMAALNGTTTE